MFEWDYTTGDFEYVYWNITMLPSFCSALMNLFEGNQQLLNLYSEIQKPSDFFWLIQIILPGLTLVVVVGVGMLGYLTFGDRIQPLIIYNLPNNDKVSIFAKAFYILTISGSFVLIIQPIFRVIETSECYHKMNDCIKNISKKFDQMIAS